MGIDELESPAPGQADETCEGCQRRYCVCYEYDRETSGRDCELEFDEHDEHRQADDRERARDMNTEARRWNR